MNELNLPDLAKTIQEKHQNCSVGKIQQVIEDALTAINQNCIEQLKNGSPVGRFEMNFGPTPFVYRLKIQKPRASTWGDIPLRYAASVRLGRNYPKPEHE